MRITFLLTLFALISVSCSIPEGLKPTITPEGELTVRQLQEIAKADGGPPDLGSWQWSGTEEHVRLQVDASEVGGAAENGHLILECSHSFLVPQAVLAFTTTERVRKHKNKETITGLYPSAKLYIAGRQTGEPGAWERVSWSMHPNVGHGLTAWSVPAAGFIRDLVRHEEMGVLVAGSTRETVTATFDVRRLSSALLASEWGC